MKRTNPDFVTIKLADNITKLLHLDFKQDKLESKQHFLAFFTLAEEQCYKTYCYICERKIEGDNRLSPHYLGLV
jgi:hypothetical protein